MSDQPYKHPMSRRFRGFLPVIIDVETGGLNHETDALLEVAAVTLHMDERGLLHPMATYAHHVKPFPDANLDPKSLELNGIDPFHPLRIALPEDQALGRIFQAIRREIKQHDCNRAILVGHNPVFDLNFIKTASERCGIKRNPFHTFSTFDTATLGGLAYGQTVLARAVQAAGLEWENSKAHSAVYDAERTAELFCNIVNRWQGFNLLGRDDIQASA